MSPLEGGRQVTPRERCWPRTAADKLRLSKKVPLVGATVRVAINYQLKFQLLESWSPPASLSGTWDPLGSSRMPSDPVRSRQIPSQPPILSSENAENYSKSTKSSSKWLRTVGFARFSSVEDNLELANRGDAFFFAFWPSRRADVCVWLPSTIN